MKQCNLLGITTLLLVLLLSACGGKNETGNFEKGFEGTYVGLLPCASCPGISTHATFFDDNKVAITSLYYDSDDTSQTEWGTWEVNGKILTATMPYETTYHYVQLSDEVIMMTDSVGTPSENLAENYQLTKETPFTSSDFEGHYVMGDIEDADAYVQNLIVTPIDANTVNIVINSKGAGKGCEFTGKGIIINNQIELDLSEQHEKMDSTMVIRFALDEEDTLFLFTSTFDDRYDLMYFCGGGGSLTGNYVKVTE